MSLCNCRYKIHRRVLKKNPLKNLRVMIKLNPYAKSARRHAILAHNPEVSTLMTRKCHYSLINMISNLYILCRSRPRCWNPRKRGLWRRPKRRSLQLHLLQFRPHEQTMEFINDFQIKPLFKILIKLSLLIHCIQLKHWHIPSVFMLNKPFIIIYKFE